jgi:hypothetical protein
LLEKVRDMTQALRHETECAEFEAERQEENMQRAINWTLVNGSERLRRMAAEDVPSFYDAYLREALDKFGSWSLLADVAGRLVTPTADVTDDDFDTLDTARVQFPDAILTRYHWCDVEGCEQHSAHTAAAEFLGCTIVFAVGKQDLATHMDDNRESAEQDSGSGPENEGDG